MPEGAWFYELRSWRGSELLIVFFGAFIAVLASIFSRKLLIVWLLLLVAIIVAPFVKPLLAPLADSAIEDKWNGETCLQSTYSTCGPASVATILKRLGRPVTEREVARAAYSYAGGTEAWYLARFVRSKGLAASFEFHNGFASSVKYPAVAGVRLGSGGHFIAILSKNGEFYLVADSLYGEKNVTENELRKRYDFTGFYMPITMAKASW